MHEKEREKLGEREGERKKERERARKRDIERDMKQEGGGDFLIGTDIIHFSAMDMECFYFFLFSLFIFFHVFLFLLTRDSLSEDLREISKNRKRKRSGIKIKNRESYKIKFRKQGGKSN